MNRSVVIVGAGMGGLAAAIRLARSGFRVQVLESRHEAGGLASGLVRGGLSFDAGPYILLDRPGLEWVFQSLGIDLAGQVALRPVHDIYEVVSGEGIRVRFFSDLQQTAAELERGWPGSGQRYVEFVRRMKRIYDRLRPMLHVSRPGLSDLVRTGAWRHSGFLLRSLGAVLARTALSPPVLDAISIWTHVAGQKVWEAPSLLAFVPALIHSVGCFYPASGIRTIPEVLRDGALGAGVAFRFQAKVRKIRVQNGAAAGVEMESGEFIPADAVVSNCGLATYLELLDAIPRRTREKLGRLPLQSPGVCAYLVAKGALRAPYLTFYLPGGPELCRLLVKPAVVVPEMAQNGCSPVRLLGPMDHARAEDAGEKGQREYLGRLLEETWWRDGIQEFRVLETRTPSGWGAEFQLYRDSMNPVMTARFMREGRLAHRSPHVRRLYMAGSATHPGQWLSFCGISGILAADCLRADLS